MVSTHLKNISQNGNLPQIGVKIKQYLKPPPNIFFYNARLPHSANHSQLQLHWLIQFHCHAQLKSTRPSISVDFMDSSTIDRKKQRFSLKISGIFQTKTPYSISNSWFDLICLQLAWNSLLLTKTSAQENRIWFQFQNCCFFLFSWFILLMEEFPNNHLWCIKSCKL